MDESPTSLSDLRRTTPDENSGEREWREEATGPGRRSTELAATRRVAASNKDTLR